MMKHEAMVIMAPHAGTLYECVAGGVGDFIDGCTPEARAVYCQRTAANARRDHIVDRIKRAFDGVPGVSTTEVNRQLFLVVIETDTGRVVLRFHKRDADGRCRLNDTDQTAQFNDDQLKLFETNLPVRRKVISLIATYQLDRLEMAAAVVGVGRHDGKDGFIWHEALTAAAAVTAPVDKPTPIEEPQPEKKRGQVRGKKTDIKKTGTKKTDEETDDADD